MVESTVSVANKFIELAAQSGGLSHMKLQKLIYLAHEDYIRRQNGKPLVAEDPEVWQYGPVFSWLYHQLKHYKTAQIRDQLDIFGTYPSVADQSALQSINDTWTKYKDASAVYLSDLTHRPGTPWRNLAEKYQFNVPRGLAIKPKDILGAK